MRIKLVVIAIACLLIGAAMTPIVSPSAKSGKGSSCKNPYRTIKSGGVYTGDLGVVRVKQRIKSITFYKSEVTLTVKPRPGFRVCRVFLKHSGKSRTSIKFPPSGGTRKWSQDTSSGPVKNILGVQVYSRRR